MEDEVRVTFRLPRPLWERVKLLADQEHRSRNGQLVVLVEESAARRPLHRLPIGKPGQTFRVKP